MTARTVAEQQALLAAHTDDGPTFDGGSGKGHFVGADVAVVRIVAIEFATAVAFARGLVLNGEPLRTSAVEALVPVEAVVAAEGHKCLVHGHRTSKEFDAVVQVGHDFDVVDGGSGTDASKGQAVDFVGSAELRSTVTDAHVGQHPRVVFVVASTVGRLVVVCWNAFHLGGSAKVGGGVTQHDQAAPLAAGVVRRRTVEGISFEGENDGAAFRAFGEDLASRGHNHGGGVHTRSCGTFDDGSCFNGQGLSAIDEDVAVQDVVVVAGPSGGACAFTVVCDGDICTL